MRGSYRARLDVVPSEQALKILESTVPNISLDRLMLLANSGTHTLNPYHNVIHELQNVYYSFSCFVNTSALIDSGPLIADLVQASLFHDHNHSGGILSDDRNVERAIEFTERELRLKEPVLNIIRCTQFVDGKFHIDPTNLAERCIRDADLMTIYSQEGFRLMIGLFEEMSKKTLSKFTEEEVRKSLSATGNFLFAQTMYTDHGNRMRDEHLDGQLVKLHSYVWRQWQYEADFRGRGSQDE
jgi:hypothetical protein